MSKLIITSVSPEIEYKEDNIERRISDREWITETVNKRFEGKVTLYFTSSGECNKEQIIDALAEAFGTIIEVNI